MSENKLIEIKRWIKGNISPKRYMHVQGVAAISRKLAIRYHLPTEKAELAGWLHDCAKELSKEEMMDWIKKSPFRLDDVEKKLPALWHPHAGAGMALKKWKIKDVQILDAVRCHTLGSPAMSPLAQIVFVGDFAEPGRIFKGVSKVRSIAFRNLNDAILMKCAMTISYLLSQNMKVHGRLVETWNYFLGQKNEK
jgi:predicted HD superfamily hydrolase involved in NAD metabolism